jgi:hypothetical protein
MNKLKIFLCLLIALCFIINSYAQSEKKVGIGIVLFDVQKLLEFSASGGEYTINTISIIYETSPTFRIEPEIGYFNGSQEISNGMTQEHKITSWRIGVGILPQKPYEKFTLYYGARVGYINENIEDESKANGYYIAPALGGEYFFSNHFSLGGEAQVVYISATTEPEDDYENWESKLSVVNTRALAFVRFYF